MPIRRIYTKTDNELITIELPDSATDADFDRVYKAHILSVIPDNVNIEIVDNSNSSSEENPG